MLHSLRLAVLLLAASVFVDAQRPPARRPLYAFFVIGPDTGAVRSQTSEWMAAEFRAAGVRDSMTMWPWRAFLESALDVTIGDDPWGQPPGAVEFGPSVPPGPVRPYPWDMRAVMPLNDQRFILTLWKLESLVQAVIEPRPKGVQLTAIELNRRDTTVVAHYSIGCGRLRACAIELAAQLQATWRTRDTLAPTR